MSRGDFSGHGVTIGASLAALILVGACSALTGLDNYNFDLDNVGGGFTTSTYYHEALPEWVRDANAALGPGLWGDTVWAFGAADSLRSRARRDDHPGEADGVHTTLPHRAHVEVDMMDRGAWGDWLENAPPPDAAVTTLALRPDPGAEPRRLEGRPIAEPVAHSGPFVMNTRDQLMQAMEDYRSGAMGEIARA